MGTKKRAQSSPLTHSICTIPLTLGLSNDQVEIFIKKALMDVGEQPSQRGFIVSTVARDIPSVFSKLVQAAHDLKLRRRGNREINFVKAHPAAAA